MELTGSKSAERWQYTVRKGKQETKREPEEGEGFFKKPKREEKYDEIRDLSTQHTMYIAAAG